MNTKELIKAVKKAVEWRWDYGVYLSFCPYCDSPTYDEKERCPFCGKEYEWTEPKYKDTQVQVGEFTVIQATNNHISIYKNGQWVCHMSCTKKMTEEELKGMVQFTKDLTKSGVDRLTKSARKSRRGRHEGTVHRQGETD